MKARKKTPLSSLFQQPSPSSSSPCKPQSKSAPAPPREGQKSVSSVRADLTDHQMDRSWEGVEAGSGPRRRQAAPSPSPAAGPPTSERLDRYRWSTYTADTSVTALESGSDDSFVKETVGKEDGVLGRGGSTALRGRSPAMVDVILPKRIGSSSSSSSREPSPSPSPEDSLNAALASMLSTANDLLSSTMAARSDLARLQTIENALDAELDRREERILMEIQNNVKMSEWVENASLKLDRMLLSTSSSSQARRPSIMTTPTATNSGQDGGATASSATSKHWRSTSITSQSVHTLDTNTSLGIFEAKDERATISKSAAKRLEKVLQRANSNSPLQASPSRSRAASTSFDSSMNTTTTPTASRLKSSINNNLSSKFGIPTEKSEQTASSASASASTISASASVLPSQPPDMAAASSSSGASTTTSTTSSVTSESAPDSAVDSSREDEEEDEEARAALDSINGSLDPQAMFLTPPTPLEELPSVEDGDAGRVQPLTKRSVSSLRSPNPLRTPGHASSGSFVSEAALGQLILDENGRATFSPGGQNGMHAPSAHGKGAALEALRRLNGGSSFSSQSPQQQQNSSQTSAGTAPPGWGGTFASWVGITSSPH